MKRAEKDLIRQGIADLRTNVQELMDAAAARGASSPANKAFVRGYCHAFEQIVSWCNRALGDSPTAKTVKAKKKPALPRHDN